MDAFWSPAAAFEIVILPGCQEVAEPSWHNHSETLLSERNHSPSGYKALLKQPGHLGSASSWGRWGKGEVGGGQASLFATKIRQESTAPSPGSVWGVKASGRGAAPTAVSEDHSPKALMELATDLNLGAWFSGSKRCSRFQVEQPYASEHRDTACRAPDALLCSLNHP